MSKENPRNKRTRKGAKTGESNDPHRQRESNKYEKPIASREFITSTLREEPGPVDFEALAEKLGLSGNEVSLEALRRRVGAMIRDGQLIQNRRRGLVPVDADNLLAGRISAHPDGFGFVVVEDSEKDIYLNGKQMRQVLHGDKVVVCVTGVDHRGRREGRIVDVVERANKSLVGRLSIDRGTAVVLPDNKRIHQDLLISPGELGEAQDGDMVVAEITEQPTRRHQPVGSIIEVLGQHLRPGMEIDVALHSHGIPVEWPDSVLEQAASFSTTVDEQAAAGRKDVRDTPLVTIDGIDARDFDDAVWCEPLEQGWRLLVAIADVAHYVTPGSALDVEAVERGTSVYFPGRVVPMLPEVLSNGLCSINPDVDRLCMICELTLSLDGDVNKVRFHNGIMRSHARLTYDQVNEMLSDESSALRKKHQSILPVIEELHKLYKVLAAKRRERGAIEFDSNETHIIFDENKKIKEIVPIERNDAHKLIEECMILANIQAAAYLEQKEIQALYRVHAGPKADRLEDLRAFLALNSLTLGGGASPSAIDYAVLAETIADRPDRSIIQTVMLRSMQQAVYQPKNEGHFGLALDQYAHFTSPIRRYPDLLVHRALKFAIAGGKPADYRYDKAAMIALGESCSVTERRAEEASRDVVSWLKCEYMQDHVGAEFEGVISAVTSFGLFVELKGIHIEGLIHITNLSRDFYKFDQAAQALNGERTGRQYRLGDAIKVQVAAVNLEERKIDFNEVDSGSQHVQVKSSSKRNKRNKGRSGRERSEAVATTAAPAVAAATNQSEQQRTASSAEKRRQQKRKRKQKRRDQKRADRRAEQQAAEARAIADKDASQKTPARGTTAKTAIAKKATAQKAPVNKAPAGKATAAKAVTHKATAKKAAAGKATAAKAVTHKATAKKAAAGKATATKAVAHKATAKKAAAGKATAAKAVAKKATAKKAIAGKATAAKAVAKKATAKKAIAGKVAAKAVAKKATAKKAIAGKATAKAVAKKANAKKATARQAVARKKATVSKATAKKSAASKTVAQKAGAKKAIARKTTANKALANKAISKKATAKKATAKKSVARKAMATTSSASKAISKKAAAKKTVAKKYTAKTSSKKVASKKGLSSRKKTGKKQGR